MPYSKKKPILPRKPDMHRKNPKMDRLKSDRLIAWIPTKGPCGC